MAETGIFKPDERVELIRGVVHRMSPKNYAHVVAATKLYQSLVKSLAGRASVFQDAPLKLVRLDRTRSRISSRFQARISRTTERRTLGLCL